MEGQLRTLGLPGDAHTLRALKAMGFSDARLAALTGVAEADIARLRHRLKVRPTFKRIDSCAAEFASPTPYLYSTYETPLPLGEGDEARPSERRKIIILGG